MKIQDRIRELEAKGDYVSLLEAKAHKLFVCQHSGGALCKWCIRPELRSWVCMYDPNNPKELTEVLKAADFDCPIGRFDAEAITPRTNTLGAARLSACQSCDKFSGNACDEVFPDGCCVSKWQAFLNANESTCPLGRWEVPQ